MKFILRPWSVKDIESVSRHSDNDKIRAKLSDAFPDCEEKWEKFLAFTSKEESRLYRAIDINGEAVGGIGVSVNSDIFRKNAELGYWLSEQYWGNGIMTSAIKQITKQAFKQFDIVRIYAAPYENNPASHRILEKAGFKLEARFEKIICKNNEMLDELIYAIRK